MKHFVAEFIGQYRTNPVLLGTEVLGTIIAVTSAATISIMTENTPFFIVYFTFFLASIMLGFTAWKQKNSRLVILNFAYAIINVIGMFNGMMLLL